MEISSYGGLPQGLSEQEIFQGYSIPRNQELMRIYKDLDYVEQLGSGVPRIIEHYGEECFRFSTNFMRIVLPSSERTTEQVTPQVTPQVQKLLEVMKNEAFSRVKLQAKLKLSDKRNFNKNYLLPALEDDLIQMTIPHKPRSSKQKYYLTEKGKTVLDNLKENK